MLPTLSGPADALRRLAKLSQHAIHRIQVQCSDTSRDHRLETLHKCDHGDQTCKSKSKSKSKLRTALIKRPEA
eukprot:scaffold44246_cov17-Prasinocladus_malaysianus.AAC.2